jgi:vitamin B12 transporter
MKNHFYKASISFLSLFIALPSLAADTVNPTQLKDKGKDTHQLNIPNLSEFQLPVTNASFLKPIENQEISQNNNLEPKKTDDYDIILDVIGERNTLPESTPTHIIEKEEIQKQGASSVADVLKRMPGFVIMEIILILVLVFAMEYHQI